MGGVFGEGGGEIQSKKQQRKKKNRMGVTFCTPSLSFPLPLFVFPFLLSLASWDARIRLSIGQYVSACLIQVDISAEWCSFVSKTFPITHSSSSSLSVSLSPFTQWGVMAISIPSRRETNTNTVATHVHATHTHTYYSTTHRNCITVNVILTSFSEAGLYM